MPAEVKDPGSGENGWGGGDMGQLNSHSLGTKKIHGKKESEVRRALKAGKFEGIRPGL